MVPLAWRRRLRLWQAGTAAALAIAASLAAFIVLRPTPAPLVAVLSAQGGHAPVLVATAEPDGVLRVRPATLGLGAQRTRPGTLGVAARAPPARVHWVCCRRRGGG